MHERFDEAMHIRPPATEHRRFDAQDPCAAIATTSHSLQFGKKLSTVGQGWPSIAALRSGMVLLEEARPRLVQVPSSIEPLIIGSTMVVLDEARPRYVVSSIAVVPLLRARVLAV